MKIAAVATHPIQYQAPLWRRLANEPDLDLHVYFASRHGLEKQADPEFGQTFAWDIPLLDGYQHSFPSAVTLPLMAPPAGNELPLHLSQEFRRRRFDAVLVHGYANGAALAGLWAGLATDTPIIIRGESHDVRRGRKTLKRRLKEELLPHLLRRVSGALAIGSWNREYWVKYGIPRDRVRVALYGVDNDRMTASVQSSAAQIQELRRRWHAGSGDTVFLFSGKLIEKKRPDVLLQAFARLNDGRARLVYVGTGSMRDELVQMANHFGVAVYWEGFVNQTIIPAYYAAADVVVLPSSFEPWGLVVNEALACGTPCLVSSQVAAGADLIAGQGTGMIFHVDDVESLATCMTSALDPRARERWRSRARAVVDRAHLRHVAPELRALFEGR